MESSVAGGTGVASVDRFLEQVEHEPALEHAYASLLGLRRHGTTDLHARLEEGLSYPAFERLRRVLDLPVVRMGELLRIAPRTLARRRESGRLEPEESDRLLRLSRLVGLALRLFEGDLDGTRRWLAAPHPSLGGASPLDFATTEVGAREVEHLVGRLEHGIVL